MLLKYSCCKNDSRIPTRVLFFFFSLLSVSRITVFAGREVGSTERIPTENVCVPLDIWRTPRGGVPRRLPTNSSEVPPTHWAVCASGHCHTRRPSHVSIRRVQQYSIWYVYIHELIWVLTLSYSLCLNFQMITELVFIITTIDLAIRTDTYGGH